MKFDAIGICPVCGEMIVYRKDQDDSIIFIKTRRRSTVLVHKDCIKQSTNKEVTK